MKKIIVIISLSLMTLACEETVVLDTEQAPPKLVIQGLVTNEMKQHWVKVSTTTGFYESGATPRVSEAQVLISDSEGNVYNFSEEEPGLYRSNQEFAGEVGVIYHLEVTMDGAIFTASDSLLAVTKFDSLEVVIDYERYADNDHDGEYYDVLMYAKEPQDQRNYYLFKFYRNGEFKNYDGEDIWITDDTAIAEDINGYETNEWYRVGDTVRTEMYSLTREGFLYWFDVSNLIFGDGGVFSAMPANPRSNIEGDALGIFQVSAVDAATVIIEEIPIGE